MKNIIGNYQYEFAVCVKYSLWNPRLIVILQTEKALPQQIRFIHDKNLDSPILLNNMVTFISSVITGS